jgi:hypothetical protein
MKLEEFIVVYDNALDPTVCDEIIKAYDGLSSTIVRDDSVMKFKEADMFHNEEFLPFKDTFVQQMQKCAAAYKTQVKAYLWPENPAYEVPRVKRYEPGEGYFDWHLDVDNVESAKRLLVMFWYLNDVDEGGQTQFVIGEEKIQVEPKKGRVVCFPPYFMFPHKGTIPVSGPKYVISSYVQQPE